MMDNHLFNLMNQMVQEHKSLWRIRNHYLEDAEDCSECAKLWEKLAEEKGKQIEELERLIKAHLI